MQTYKIAVIRVVTLTDNEKLNRHGKLIESYFPNLLTTSYCIPNQINGVHDDESHEIAEEKIEVLVKQIKHQYDGIIVSCAGDPCVKRLRGQLKIPIVGAGHSLASLGLNYGEKIGVIGIRKTLEKSMNRLIGDKVIEYIKPAVINNTNDLYTALGKESVIKVAKQLEQNGAEVIILACTGMSTVGITNLLNEQVSIPVIDPVFAEAMVINNMCQYQRIINKK